MKISRSITITVAVIVLLTAGYFAYMEWHFYQETRLVPEEDGTYYRVQAAITQRDKDIRFNRIIAAAINHPNKDKVKCDTIGTYDSVSGQYETMYDFFEYEVSKVGNGLPYLGGVSGVIDSEHYDYTDFNIEEIKTMGFDNIEVNWPITPSFLQLLHCKKKTIR